MRISANHPARQRKSHHTRAVPQTDVFASHANNQLSNGNPPYSSLPYSSSHEIGRQTEKLHRRIRTT